MYYNNSTQETRVNDREKGLYQGTQVVWYILSVIEVFLILGFVMKLLGANIASGFTQFIYSIAGFFNAPFHLIFGSSVPAATGTTFEWDFLVAMVIYYLIAVGIIRIFGMGRQITKQEAHDDLESNS